MNPLTKMMQATKHSLSGIKMALKQERAVRLEMAIFTPLILIALAMDFTKIEKILLIFPIMMVFSCELLNTAVEKLIDELGQGKICPTFKFAKDVGSSAVFFMILMTILSWSFIIF
jgi:diacylglycerol kinase (ATP)